MNTVLCRSEHLAQPSLSSPSTKLTLTNLLIHSGFVSTQMHRRQCGRTPYYQQQSASISPSAQINGSLTSPCHAAQHNCQHLLTPFWQGPHLRILDLLFPFFSFHILLQQLSPFCLRRDVLWVCFMQPIYYIWRLMGRFALTAFDKGGWEVSASAEGYGNCRSHDNYYQSSSNAHNKILRLRTQIN